MFPLFPLLHNAMKRVVGSLGRPSGRPVPTAVATGSTGSTDASDGPVLAASGQSVQPDGLGTFERSAVVGANFSASVPRPSQRLPSEELVGQFLAWIAEHGLAGEHPVDSVWFLASEDFGPALGLILPSRPRFLGALQRQPGVIVEYDRRRRNRLGKITGKTTIYTLTTERMTDAGVQKAA